VDAEINNVIYMELNSGPKMTDGKYRKTYVAGSVDRENTVYGFIIYRIRIHEKLVINSAHLGL
jgi:hypothetical protein